MEELKKGILLNFSGSWGSGIGSLRIKDCRTGAINDVPCENTSTVRALEEAFGNTITGGRTASGTGYKNKKVYWFWDDMGLILGGFIPVETATKELRGDYLAQFKKRSTRNN